MAMASTGQAALLGLHTAPRPRPRPRPVEQVAPPPQENLPPSRLTLLPPAAPPRTKLSELDELKSLAASFPGINRKALTPSLARGARARALAASQQTSVHPRLNTRRRRPNSGEMVGSSADGVDAEPPSELRQQLARSMASSDKLMQEVLSMSSRADRSELLLQLPTRYLLVGTCDCRFAGVAKFLPTKVIYAFEHPVHRHVEMHMAYDHMVGVRPRPAGGASRSGGVAPGGELRFRIAAPLAYFSKDYDHANDAHELRIGFETVADFKRFEKAALPQIASLAKLE